MIKFKNKLFSMINESDIGNKYTFKCKIEDIKQTSGPTIFILNDGTSLLKATGFISAGERAFPDINKKDFVETELLIKKRKTKLEGEIVTIKKLTKNETNTLIKKIKQKNKPFQTEFLIETEILNKLKPELLKAAEIIRSAIFENTPILIKHHADCDGYSGAIAIERAIIPLIRKNHNSQKSEFNFYTRSPSMAPFYEYSDVLRDLGNILDVKKKFDKKNPLIILIDLGNIKKNILAIKRLKMYDFKVIVIDHHDPGEKGNIEKIKKLADLYINPFCVGFDSSFVCGMICTELARLINENVKNIEFLPALAGTADKSDKDEFTKYLKISEYSKEFLEKFAICVDFETYYIKYQESRELIEDLFRRNKINHENLINKIYEQVKQKIQETQTAVEKYVEVQKIDDIKFIKIDCEKVSSYGEFPTPSKVVRISHDLFKGKRISIGILQDSIIFRVNEVEKFDVNELVNDLKKQKPYALIEGGGHKFAGTLKFIPVAKKEILK
jgi:RecJ-like exonuclease